MRVGNNVIPSPDAVSQDVFEKINRPYPGLKIKGIIEGLKTFRNQLKGEIWLEVMLVKGINDGADTLEHLGELIPELGCDRGQHSHPTTNREVCPASGV